MSPDDSFLPPVTAAHAQAGAAARGWDAPSRVAGAGWWIVVRHRQAARRAQGWKLHVSAALVSAGAVLARVLPVLWAETASFKVLASGARLAEFAESPEHLSQVGKLLTVYPNDDAQAVRLAVALDRATRGLRGPAIPSDRPLRPGSLVHYRYGVFRAHWMQLPGGEILEALHDPDGRLQPDARVPAYHAPAWVEDPFVAAGVAADLPEAQALLGGRYLIVRRLDRSPRGTLAYGLDVAGLRRCVIKRAGRDAMLDRYGRDARDRLRHEAAILARLAPDPRFPAPFDLLERDDELFLVMEEVPGETLRDHVSGLGGRGGFLPAGQIAAWGREVAAMLETIHAHGLVYGDIKPGNVMVALDGHLRLVDFDRTYDPALPGPPPGRGTRGYMSPQQEADAPPTSADDVYGLGGLLYFLATGADLSYAAPDCPPSWINPAIGPALADLIARCRAADSTARYPRMADVARALRGLGREGEWAPPSFGGEPALGAHATSAVQCGDLARRVSRTLCKAMQAEYRPPPGEPAPEPPDRDLYTGSAGRVLALAELAGEFADHEALTVLAQSAQWLVVAPGPEGPPLPGLYRGQAGIGAALLRAGQVLGNRALIVAAGERGRQVAALPYTAPDLFTGAAGRARFHLWLWDETGAAEQRDAACAAGQWLLATAQERGDGELCWPYPPGFAELSGKIFFGYAHGAAGIADVLLDLYEASGDSDFREAAARAGRWIAAGAAPLLDDGSGRGWPSHVDAPPEAGFWCHGAPGIGRFWLHAARLDLLPEATALAAQAARTAAHGTRWAGPTQCHGLASNIEFLLDMYQALGDEAYLDAAWSQARILQLFATEQDGDLIWPSDTPGDYSPAYMVGYAGVAACLLRLADPARRPTQLSRAGFRPLPVGTRAR